jgi:hypothetical protein
MPGHGAAHAIAKPVRAHLTRLLHVNWVLILGVLIPGGVIVALLIAFLGVPALRRRLRRLARHQEDDPAALAAGAWLELVDGLFRLGLEVGPSATSTQVVERVADRFGDDFGPPTSLVAALADQALYSTRWPVDESRAQLAWHSQHVLRRRLRHQVGRRERAQALLMVGPSPPRRTAEAQL